MGFVHGTNAVFKLDNSGGTLQDLSTYIVSVTLPLTIDTDETTTLGKTAKTYIPTLEDGTISVEGKRDTVVDAHMNEIRRTIVTFEYYPEGESGVKYSGECFLTSYEQGSEVSAANTWSAELQCTDSITRTAP